MLHKKFPKFLDKILLAFTDDFNQPKSLEQLKQIVFKKELSSNTNNLTADEHLSRMFTQAIDYNEYLEHALSFLQQEKLVVLNDANYSITSKGYFKIKTESFVQKIKNDKLKNILQISVWVAALFTFLAMIYTTFIKTTGVPQQNIHINCTCKYPETCPNWKQGQLNK